MDDNNNNQRTGLTQKQTYWIVSIVAVILVLSLGYWFMARPYYIRKHCEQFAVTAASNGGELNSFELNNTYPGIYQACLDQRGL
jgi:hypothetical protein